MSVRIIKIEALECTCERCGAVWVPRPVKQGHKWVTLMPVACASCKQAYWNRPKLQRDKGK